MVSAPQRYDEAFYDELNAAGSQSAAAILPLVLDALSPKSAVDVGCGTGVWTRQLQELGVADVVAVDGDYVPKHQRVMEPSAFQPVDLAETLKLGRTFDLAVCVEVAEHLSHARATSFVADLCRHAPAILFSAAPPGQGGTHHINEQWPEYWIERFLQHGFECWDVIRPRIRYDPNVAWIYRQNVMLVLHKSHRLAAGLPREHLMKVAVPGDVRFEYVAQYLLEREPNFVESMARVGMLLRRRVARAGMRRPSCANWRSSSN